MTYTRLQLEGWVDLVYILTGSVVLKPGKLLNQEIKLFNKIVKPEKFIRASANFMLDCVD